MDYGSTYFLREFPTKNWTRRDLDNLLVKMTTLDRLIVWRGWSLSMRHRHFPRARDARLVSLHVGHISSINSNMSLLC